jgi:hypothetical protein
MLVAIMCAPSVVSDGAVPVSEDWKPKLWLARTLEQAIVMIEEMTGEELTPEEVEELRQVFGDDDQEPRSVH